MKHLDMTMHETIEWWSTIDCNGTSLSGVRTLCLTDRFYLLVNVCKRVDMLHPWLYARCREVEKDSDDYLDLWAREHYKSTIITFGGVIQEILKDPEVTACIFSHTNGIATKFLKQIKTELETNETLKAAFPDVLYADPQKQAPQWSVEGGITVKRKSNPKESTLEASGLVDGQPISKHYKLRVYDDVVVPASVSTPEQSEKTTDAYSMSQSLGAEGGRKWMIGTRYSYSDTYDWIMRRSAMTPRIYQVSDNGDKNGPLVLFSKERWADIMLNSTDSDIASQYMQDPLSGNQRMFDIGYIREYEARPEAINVYILIDPARSKKKGSADTAMIAVGVDYAMNKYILDGFCHKMDLQERWENMCRLYVRWKVAPGVQNVRVGYEMFGAQADADYFKEQMKLPDRPVYEIVELYWPRDTEGSKEDRVQRLVPDVKSGKLFVPFKHKNKEHEGKLTSLQIRMKESGYDYRIAQEIRRKDENNKAYDLTDKLLGQVHYFPLGKKDAVDALARIYDMEPKPPTAHSINYMEPEFA